MKFKEIFVSMALLGVVMLGIFSFVIQTQTDNNPAQLITNNTIINDSYGNLIIKLGESKGSADEAETTFGKVPPTESFGIVDVNSVVSPTRLFRSLTVGTYNILIALPVKILGVSPIIAGVLSAILFALLILGMWAIWRGVAG